MGAPAKTPIFIGRKFMVWSWQRDELARMLAPRDGEFDLTRWFRDLDARCYEARILVPQFEELTRWLYEQTKAEALRRGYAFAAPEKDRYSPRTRRLLEAMRNIAAEAKGKLL